MNDTSNIVIYSLLAIVVLLLGTIVMCTIFCSDMKEELRAKQKENIVLQDSLTHYREWYEQSVD